MTDLHETAEYLRRMGEPEASVQYRLTHDNPAPSILEMFGEALRPGIPPVAVADTPTINKRLQNSTGSGVLDSLN